MKIIRTANGSLMNVKDAVARKMIAENPHDYFYATREEWKKEVRDKNRSKKNKEK